MVASNSSSARLHATAMTAGFAAVPQRPIVAGFDELRLIAVTDQHTHAMHPAIRVTAAADRTPRGWKDSDAIRLRDLCAYADRTGEDPLVLIAARLDPEEAAVVMPARKALSEAVDEITTRLAHRAEQATRTHRWWCIEMAGELSNHHEDEQQGATR